MSYTLTQRLYARRTNEKPCTAAEEAESGCSPEQREWASWRITQKYFFDPDFGGAIIPNHRNVFDTTLDLSGIAFLTAPRNLSPVVSRLRF